MTPKRQHQLSDSHRDNTASGLCTRVVNYPNPTFSDNCSGSSVQLQSGQWLDLQQRRDDRDLHGQRQPAATPMPAPSP
jgi:hypothetical protein